MKVHRCRVVRGSLVVIVGIQLYLVVAAKRELRDDLWCVAQILDIKLEYKKMQVP